MKDITRKYPDNTVPCLITEHQRRVLERDLEKIDDADGDFIPWEKARKELGLQAD